MIGKIKQRVELICRLIIGSLTGENPNEHFISVDAKTYSPFEEVGFLFQVK